MNRLSMWTLLATICLATTTLTARADDRFWRTSTSLIGKSKYDGGFTHYEHVNPDAPKGGTFNSMANGTFDSFNPFIVKGTTAAGLNYQGGLLWDLMMAKAIDEPSASHPPSPPTSPRRTCATRRKSCTFPA